MDLLLSSCFRFGCARGIVPPRNTSGKFPFCWTLLSGLTSPHPQSSLVTSTAVQYAIAATGSTRITLLLSTDFASWDWKVPITYSLESSREQSDIRRIGI